ncbi:MAG TPA: sugar phosphate isomerase/epimerase family protein [Deltaproteobacteria bacterium]|nr:sugar phosphate isomerase/epimerase family protein [Deltaproteobacteria bacterium]HQJ09598.1 sugar phosphate isomerase/epimerase family protein [Deltaproteobacteria bacterium]
MTGKGAVIGGRAHTIEQIREVCALGYPFAEISLSDPETVRRDLDELLSIKEQFGISYLAHYPNEDNPFDAGVLKERFVPRIKSLVDLSRELDIPKATIHFWMDTRWAEAGLIPKKIDLLREMASYAQGQGVVLCIENLSERCESFLAAFDAAPELRMTLDIGHAQLLSAENTSWGFITHAFERIFHIHVHDNHGGKSVKDDQHLPIGQGIIDYPGILSELKKRGYGSTITMELKPFEMPGTKKLLEEYLS